MNNELLQQALQADLLQDPLAYAIVTYFIIHNVNGEIHVTRKFLAAYFHTTEHQVYKALQKVTSLTALQQHRNSRSTTISLSQQAKHEHFNNTATADQQQVNDHKEIPSSLLPSFPLNNPPYISPSIPSQKVIADKLQSRISDPGKKKTIRIPTALQETVKHLEVVLDTKIVNWGKQAKAYDMMTKAGYTDEQIRKSISYMATRDEFFKDKGFDLMTVANYIATLKAKERRLQ